MDFSEIFNIILIINIIIAILIVLLDNRSPSTSLTWIILFIFLPVVGLILFLMVGINWKKRKLIKQNPEELFDDYFKDITEKQKNFIKEISQKNEKENDKAKLVNLLLNTNNSVLTTSNSCKIYIRGKDFYKDLLYDLKNAVHSIHMEFFIWRSDNLGNKIKDILIRKAAEGIKIRLIFDGIGSLGRISFKYRKELKKAGIEFKYFLNLAAPFSIFKINYSNHRKIAVIDGKKGYTGGMNVGDEYITGGKFPSWRDTQIRLTGENISVLQGIFIIDWENSGGKIQISDEYFPKIKEKRNPLNNRLPVQFAISGADSMWASIQQMYFSMINNANSEIYIQTPYFIPDQGLMSALEIASLSGVKVNLMITGIPDKRLPFWAAHTYFEPLLNAGVNIFLYKKGFLHSKVIVIDKEISSVGSCNFDMRSFRINYEINTVIYDQKISEKMIDIFKKDMEESLMITKEYLKNLSFAAKVRNSFFRLLSPIM